MKHGFAHIILIAVLAATLAIFGLVYFKSLQKTPYTNSTQSTTPKTSKTTTRIQTEPELTAEDAQKMPQIPPSHITARRDSGKIIVSWQSTESDGAAEYKVYGRTSSSNNWQLLGSVKYRAGIPTFEFLTNSTATQYTVSTVSIYGTEGPQGETATVN